MQKRESGDWVGGGLGGKDRRRGMDTAPSMETSSLGLYYSLQHRIRIMLCVYPPLRVVNYHTVLPSSFIYDETSTRE